jgi:hypothetical protein
MGKYITDAYTRVSCTKCGNKTVDIIKPGTPFDKIKTCPCEDIKEIKDMDIDELKGIAKGMNLPFPSNIGKESLIKKIKGIK